MDASNGITSGLLSAIVLLVLLGISWGFNHWVEAAGPVVEGWAWLLVVVGVTYTQMAVGMLDTLLGWNAFYLGMLAFAVSGFPMIYGAYMRHKDMQERARKALHEQ